MNYEKIHSSQFLHHRKTSRGHQRVACYPEFLVSLRGTVPRLHPKNRVSQRLDVLAIGDRHICGYSDPSDSPCWVRILSIFGDIYEMECESFSEALSTISQLAEFHPGGKIDLGQPFFDFEPCKK